MMIVMMFNVMLIVMIKLARKTMVMRIPAMKMITMRSDSYHHCPAPTPHPVPPFPLMSIHSKQRKMMMTKIMAMMMMMMMMMMMTFIICHQNAHDQGSKSNILKVAMKSKMTVLKYFPGLVLLTTTGFDPKTSLVH